ncbi:hypothetical protein DF054_20855 [Burkholderia cepacia]|nr:hypothetical protein DF055_18050 [Burkholderia cepacia]RRA05876.1 hypothetical protein DF054_20855 [Burkholderia cepacia]
MRDGASDAPFQRGRNTSEWRETHAQWSALYINQNAVLKSTAGGPLILTMAVTIDMLRECPEARTATRVARPASGTRDRYNRSF